LKWRDFIDKRFANGDKDNYARTAEPIDAVKKLNGLYGGILDAGVKIFQARHEKNYNGKSIDPAEASELLKNLKTTETDLPSYIEAFQDFADAEFISLTTVTNDNASVKAYQKFLDNYPKVETAKWRSAAYLNIGNAFYYGNDFSSAVSYYEQIPEKERDGSSYANEINAFCSLDTLDGFDKAIEAGNKALEIFRGKENDKTNVTLVNIILADMLQVYVTENKFSDGENLYKKYFGPNSAIAVVPQSPVISIYALLLLFADGVNSYNNYISEQYSLLNEHDSNVCSAFLKLSEGDKDGALKCFEKAYALNPEKMQNDSVFKLKLKTALDQDGFFQIPRTKVLLEKIIKI
jgi:tetratricopeptide (TPR) repeat protein